MRRAPDWSLWAGPPVWSRWTIRALALAVLCVIAALVLLVLRITFGWGKRGPASYAIYLLALVPFIIHPITNFSHRHIRRAWRDSKGRLCTHCAYDLSANEPEGLCPECGRAYDIESDAILWKNAGLTREPPQS